MGNCPVGNCPSGELSEWGIVQWGIVRVGNCPGSAPMDAAMLSAWGTSDNFLCRNCAFTSGTYDLEASLNRYVHN